MIIYSSNENGKLQHALRSNLLKALDFSLYCSSKKFPKYLSENVQLPLTYQEIAPVLSILLSPQNALQNLSLRNVRLDEQGFNFLLSLLESHNHLEQLDLIQTGLTAEHKSRLRNAVEKFQKRTGRSLPVRGVYSPYGKKKIRIYGNKKHQFINNNPNNNNNHAESLNNHNQEENIPIPAQNFSFFTDWYSPSIEALDKTVCKHYRCPITGKIMRDPVLTADGYTYEREAIAKWLIYNDTNPLTYELLVNKNLIPNHPVRNIIQDFLDKNPAYSDEIYISKNLVTELLELTATWPPLNLQRWREILQNEPRLLTAQLPHEQTITTLFTYLCDQSKNIVVTLIPEFLSRLTSLDLEKLMRKESIQKRLQQLTRACGSSLETIESFFAALQNGLKINISAVELTLYAITARNSPLLQFGLRQIPDINQSVDKERNTLLHFAVKQNEIGIVQFLIDRGANSKLTNNQGLTPTVMARKAGFQEIMTLLNKLGVNSKLNNPQSLKATPIVRQAFFKKSLNPNISKKKPPERNYFQLFKTHLQIQKEKILPSTSKYTLL